MATNLKAQLFDLADQDRACLERIKARLEIQSSALAVRIAIRDLAKRLSQPEQLREPASPTSAEREMRHD